MDTPDVTQVAAIFSTRSERTIEVFRLPHNSRYLYTPPPVPRLLPVSHQEARIPLPSDSKSAKGKQRAERDETPDAEAYTVPNPILCFRLDVPPKDIGLGWVFGRDAAKCDILLDESDGSTISKMHFRLDFDWVSMSPLIYNMSKNCTNVKAPGQPKALGVGDHQPILEHYVTFAVEHLCFSVKRPGLNPQRKNAYQLNWQNYRRQTQKEPPGLTQLQVGSQPDTVTPLVVRGPASKGQYVVGGLLGHGSFGIVFLVKQKKTEMTYALKRCIPKQESQKEKFDKEIEIYKTLEHDRIVRFVDTFIDQTGNAALVMEFMSMGSLSSHHKKSAITVIENHRLVYQVLEALLYLHRKGITHRDLKPDNILVSAREPALFIKVADFGVSTEVGDDYLKTLCGTPIYCAPEMFSGEYRRSVDIWAVGVMGLKYMKGLPEIRKKPNKKLDHKLWVSQIRTSVEEATSSEEYEEFAKGLKMMLELDPGKRPTAAQCIDNRWFRGCQTHQEKLRGPAAIGFLAQLPHPQVESHPRSQDVAPTMASEGAGHRLSSSKKEPPSKRPKKA